MPARFTGFACWLILTVATPGVAAVYDFSLGDAGNRTVRMNIPASVTTIRGLLIWGNGLNSDLRGMATDPEMVAWAESMQFAVIGTSMWTSFMPGYSPSEYSAWQNTLAQLATMSGHPEITRVPWLPVGQSNGGSMSYGLNTLAPEKVIACQTNKAWGYNNTRPSAAALQTPCMHLAGEFDRQISRDTVRDLFEGNRPRGALWCWTEEQASTHNYGDSFELLLPFVAEVCQLRYPVSATSYVLPALTERNGWLADTASGPNGFAEIASYQDYTKDRTRAGWLPSRRMAYIFRAFASFDLARYEVTLSSGHGPIDWGTAVTYAIGAPVRDWSRIEFYEGDVLLKTTTPADGDPLAVEHRVARTGYNVFHALITFADETRRTTMIRRVFVRAPGSGAVAGPTVLTAGGSTTLTAAAPQAGATCRWQMNTGSAWADLSDGPGAAATIAGATSASLTLSDATAALDGAQLRCRWSAGTPSQAVTLSIATPPVATVVTAAPEHPVDAGSRVSLEVTAPSGASVQWYHDRVAIAGATAARLDRLVGTADAGDYTARVVGSNGLASVVELGALHVRTSAWLTNLSARASAGIGDNALIGGFCTSTPDSAVEKTLLIRGVGPTLALDPFRVPGTAASVDLELFDESGGSLERTRTWNATLAAMFARLGAFALPAGGGDAAVARTFGAHERIATAMVRPADGAAGISLVEIYDADSNAPERRLVNLSARARAGGGATLIIGGFVIQGTTSQTVLIRGVGLGMRQFLSSSLLKPVLVLRDKDGHMIARSRGRFAPIERGESPVEAAVIRATNRTMNRVGAFLLPMPQMTGYESGWDSAFVATLPPGIYTALLSGENDSGIALVEIYEVP